jgi:regulator of replication initiation timing
MYIKKEVYDALIGAHMREIAAMEQTIKRMDTIIEALRRENQNLENRLAYNKAKALEHLAKREKKPAKPYPKPSIKAEDNREELRNDNRDDDNHYHKMPEE